MQALIKAGPKYRKVIHEDLQEPLYHVRKDAHHISLESSRRIAEPKGHASVCECTKWAYECSLLLVLRSYWYLVVAGVSI